MTNRYKTEQHSAMSTDLFLNVVDSKPGIHPDYRFVAVRVAPHDARMIVAALNATDAERFNNLGHAI